MANKYISLKEDVSRLISIFELEVKEGENKQLTIYCYEDKKLPPNPIVYYHEKTINDLQALGVLKIINTDRNIDAQGIGFGGPLFYLVEVFGSEVKKRITASKTVTKQLPRQLPEDVHWVVEETRYLLEFDKGKKLEFDDISKPSAKYFFLLMENYGLPVSHEVAKKKTGKILNTEVKNLVKTLRNKIENNMLKKLVTINPSKKGAYFLLISSEKLK